MEGEGDGDTPPESNRVRAGHLVGLGLAGAAGCGGRPDRVATICLGLACAPLGSLPWTRLALGIATWATVVQRVLSVRRQLVARAEADAAPDDGIT